MKEILMDYIVYTKNNLISFLTLTSSYLIPLVILFLIFHIILAYTIDSIYKNMKKDINPVIWIPILNIYYLGKQIHSLYGTVMIIETLLLFSYPYKTHGIWTISKLCSNKITNLLIILLIIQIPLSIAIILYKYLKYENRIRIIK